MFLYKDLAKSTDSDYKHTVHKPKRNAVEALVAEQSRKIDQPPRAKAAAAEPHAAENSTATARKGSGPGIIASLAHILYLSFPRIDEQSPPFLASR